MWVVGVAFVLVVIVAGVNALRHSGGSLRGPGGGAGRCRSSPHRSPPAAWTEDAKT